MLKLKIKLSSPQRHPASSKKGIRSPTEVYLIVSALGQPRVLGSEVCPEHQHQDKGPPAVTPEKPKPPLALELCCGHAGLAFACCKVGFVGQGVDWQGNKHKPVVPIMRIDLTTQEGQKEVWRILREENIFSSCPLLSTPCQAIRIATFPPLFSFGRKLRVSSTYTTSLSGGEHKVKVEEFQTPGWQILYVNHHLQLLFRDWEKTKLENENGWLPNG